jgi:hypothetical protein
MDLSPIMDSGIYFWTILSRLQGHSAAGRIMSMKKSCDSIGNLTRVFPVCSAVPQPLGLVCTESFHQLHTVRPTCSTYSMMQAGRA